VLVAEQQCTPAGEAQLPGVDLLEYVVGEVEEADVIRDRCAAATDPAADLFAGESEVLDHGCVGAGLLTGEENYSDQAVFSGSCGPAPVSSAHVVSAQEGLPPASNGASP
jgi:hypothetical protein